MARLISAGGTAMPYFGALTARRDRACPVRAHVVRKAYGFIQPTAAIPVGAIRNRLFQMPVIITDSSAWSMTMPLRCAADSYGKIRLFAPYEKYDLLLIFCLLVV
jgi:hypothetical protein